MADTPFDSAMVEGGAIPEQQGFLQKLMSLVQAPPGQKSTIYDQRAPSAGYPFPNEPQAAPFHNLVEKAAGAVTAPVEAFGRQWENLSQPGATAKDVDPGDAISAISPVAVGGATRAIAKSVTRKPPPTSPEHIAQYKQSDPAAFMDEYKAVYAEMTAAQGEAKAAARGMKEIGSTPATDRLSKVAQDPALTEMAEKAAAWRLWMKDQGPELGSFGSAPAPKKISRELMDNMQALARDPKTTSKTAYDVMKSMEGFGMDEKRFHTLFSQFRNDALGAQKPGFGPSTGGGRGSNATSKMTDEQREFILKGSTEDKLPKKILQEYRTAHGEGGVTDSYILQSISRLRNSPEGMRPAWNARGTAAKDLVDTVRAQRKSALERMNEPQIEEIIKANYGSGQTLREIGDRLHEVLRIKSEMSNPVITAQMLKNKLKEMADKGKIELLGTVSAIGANMALGDEAKAQGPNKGQDPIEHFAKEWFPFQNNKRLDRDELQKNEDLQQRFLKMSPREQEEVKGHFKRFREMAPKEGKDTPFGPAMKLGGAVSGGEGMHELSDAQRVDAGNAQLDSMQKEVDRLQQSLQKTTDDGARQAIWKEIRDISDAAHRFARTGRENVPFPTYDRQDLGREIDKKTPKLERPLKGRTPNWRRTESND